MFLFNHDFFVICCLFFLFLFFFFNDTATTEIYTLSLHDALPISPPCPAGPASRSAPAGRRDRRGDRKSTRLNSSHRCISYAVFCLKNKKKKYLNQLKKKIKKYNINKKTHITKK